jgi:hypothetical protein
MKNYEVKFPINKKLRDNIKKESFNKKKRSKTKQIEIKGIRTQFDIKIK